MTNTKDMLEVHVNIEIPAAAISAIVENSKKFAGRDASGRYRVDPAAKLGEMISLFLERYDFNDFVQNPENYPED
jgi:hypothetical protein